MLGGASAGATNVMTLVSIPLDHKGRMHFLHIFQLSVADLVTLTGKSMQVDQSSLPLLPFWIGEGLLQAGRPNPKS